MNPTVIIITCLLLSACSHLTSLPYLSKDDPITASTPGVAISQGDPPQLASIAFVSDTQFNSNLFKSCVSEHLLPLDEGSAIAYVGKDILTAQGLLAGEQRQFGVLTSYYQVRFTLAALAQSTGTRYGFSNITLAQEDSLNYNHHDFRPLAATSNDLSTVYASFKELFITLDDCMADSATTTTQAS